MPLEYVYVIPVYGIIVVNKVVVNIFILRGVILPLLVRLQWYFLRP